MEHNHNHNHSGEACCCEHEHHHDDGCGCGHDHEHSHDNENKSEFLFKVVGGAVLLAAGYIMHEFTALPDFASLLCFGISYLLVGFSIIKEAAEGIIHGNIFNECFLMAIASLGAFAIGEYTEGCAVVLLYTIGEYLQGMALGKSRKSIKAMLEMKPVSVKVLRNGKAQEISPDEIKIGDEFIVNPGERIDIDGVIVKGRAQIDMKALTGESIPVSMQEGSAVLSGAVCLDGALTIRAEKEYKDSTVSQILKMVEESAEKKSKTEKFISRFAKIYTPVVCLIALFIIVVPPLFFNGEWSEWIYRGLSALVVSCPCAIVISVPLGFFGGIGACSKQGILIKGSNHLEMLSKCNIGVFDKTGTITSGKFEYVNCECVHCHCEHKAEHRELLGLIAACEKFSDHPIAKSVSLAFGHYADEYTVENAENYAGMGVSAVVNGVKYYAGNEKLMASVGVDFKETELIGTAIYLCNDEEFLGNIVFADVIKQDSKEAIAAMKKAGIAKTVMLTGDKEIIAKDIAEKAGIDSYYAKLLPQDKVAKIRELKAQPNALVLYTGDGINDAPVLAEADLGVAMGGIGADAAIEAADVVIMGDSLSKIPQGRKISKKTMKIVHENIIFSIGVKLLIIIGCAVGVFDENAMWLAVFGDVGVCLLAIANSLRAMIYSRQR